MSSMIVNKISYISDLVIYLCQRWSIIISRGCELIKAQMIRNSFLSLFSMGNISLNSLTMERHKILEKIILKKSLSTYLLWPELNAVLVTHYLSRGVLLQKWKWNWHYRKKEKRGNHDNETTPGASQDESACFALD